MEHDVTHKQIFDRLIGVEQKVDDLDKKTSKVVVAFQAAEGAFVVLEMLGKIAKPIIWVLAVGSAVTLLWSEFWKR
tara:strand:- start:4279 stop:4506 length:228 start_codon:yes stop_codon:yes gene_type:complete